MDEYIMNDFHVLLAFRGCENPKCVIQQMNCFSVTLKIQDMWCMDGKAGDFYTRTLGEIMDWPL